MLRYIIIAFAIATFAKSTLAWEVIEDWRDPIGGQSYTAASDTNEDGFSIFIFRDSDNKVRAVYSLPTNTFDRMPREGRALSIRPDDFSASVIEVSIVDTGVVENGRSNGQSARDVLWHGQDPSPTRGTLRNILDSDTLFARFYTDTGSSIDTSWSMRNGPDAIGKAAGFSVIADIDDVNWSNIQADLLISSTNRCGVDRGCIKRTSACMHLIIEGRDIDGFNQCLDNSVP